MPNPNGNSKRCRTCSRLAGKDGWCKSHRPKKAEKRINPFRENFMPDEDSVFFGDHSEFGIVKDKFGMEDRWG
jgi:hypothetical protein